MDFELACSKLVLVAHLEAIVLVLAYTLLHGLSVGMEPLSQPGSVMQSAVPSPIVAPCFRGRSGASSGLHYREDLALAHRRTSLNSDLGDHPAPVPPQCMHYPCGLARWALEAVLVERAPFLGHRELATAAVQPPGLAKVLSNAEGLEKLPSCPSLFEGKLDLLDMPRWEGCKAREKPTFGLVRC